MIQRIQTVFLFFAFAFQLSMIFLPLAFFILPDKNVFDFVLLDSNSESILNLQPVSLFALILLIIISFILLIIIFLFKNRSLQMKLCLVNIILLVLFQLLLFYIVWNAGQIKDVVTNYKISIAFPLVSAILAYLAYRFIRKDEKLIRSIDRIR